MYNNQNTKLQLRSGYVGVWVWVWIVGRQRAYPSNTSTCSDLNSPNHTLFQAFTLTSTPSSTPTPSRFIMMFSSIIINNALQMFVKSRYKATCISIIFF